MPFTEEKVTVRDGMFNVTLRRGGSGRPLVYLHGAAGQAAWDPFLDLLSDRFSVYVPTHPGWPGSDGLEHIDNVIDMALYYQDLFDVLGLAPVDLVGSSLGGMFAAEIAALGRPYVRRLVLQAPVGLWLDDHPTMDIFAASQEELMAGLYADPQAMAAQMPRPDPEDKMAMARAMLDRTQSMAATGKFVWPLPDKGLKKRIHRITAPTLLVWGEKDGLVPPAYGPEFQRRIAGSRLVTIADAAHVPMTERPEEFVRIVREFLEG